MSLCVDIKRGLYKGCAHGYRDLKGICGYFHKRLHIKDLYMHRAEGHVCKGGI